MTTTERKAVHTPSAGMAVARCVFNMRGNHSGVHLSENDLAVIVQAAVDVALAKKLVGDTWHRAGAVLRKTKVSL